MSLNVTHVHCRHFKMFFLFEFLYTRVVTFHKLRSKHIFFIGYMSLHQRVRKYQSYFHDGQRVNRFTTKPYSKVYGKSFCCVIACLSSVKSTGSWAIIFPLLLSLSVLIIDNNANNSLWLPGPFLDPFLLEIHC